MVFKCQEDSFLKEFTSTVTSCTKTEFNTLVDGKKTTVGGYEVVCEDTVLFPEGGGQPSDQGYLNDKKVYQVVRRGALAVHLTEEPLNIGDKVVQKIDWDRRLDHMQQHSGQHLITAIIDREFKYSTVSWWLGEEVSHIELDTTSLTNEEIKKAEVIVNELIREGRKVTVDVINAEEQVNLNDIHARGLPKDHVGDVRINHVGDVRIITIEGIESNMCCGTHVSNLCQLQVIKLLHAEKSGRKSNMLLYFLVGNRVLNRLAASIEREQRLTAILNNNPVQHVELVDKLAKNSKVLSKNLQTVLKDLVAFEAQKLREMSPLPKYYMLHRKEAEPDYMNQFIKNFGSTDVFLVLSVVGDEKGAGSIIIYGEEDDVAALGNKICELFNGKGAGRGNKFNAKVNSLNNRKKVEELLKEYFK
ncbi:Threonyl and Alanyl tRNA synthetase second additional domain [Popillia japonica]|uniref:Threonyl and Alanyl tRNA synthetase second additional domain n=1 Tax=Popillia japonica TaxID=7064 RepID=A0AAW1L8D3_POPJA